MRGLVGAGEVLLQLAALPACQPACLRSRCAPPPCRACRSMANAEALPPLASAAELCESLRSSPALRDMLLVARPGHVHGVSAPRAASVLRAAAWPCRDACVPRLLHGRLQTHCPALPCPPSQQAMKLVLEVMLSLRGLRPDLTVRPIEHTGALGPGGTRSALLRPLPPRPSAAAACCCSPSQRWWSTAAAAAPHPPPADFFVEEPSPDQDEEAAAAPDAMAP